MAGISHAPMRSQVGVSAVLLALVVLLTAATALAPATSAGAVADPNASPVVSVRTFSGREGRVMHPRDLSAGPDGNLWFTADGDRLGFITPQGKMTTFDTHGQLRYPSAMIIGRITTSGTITTFSAQGNAADPPIALAAGPDGNVYYATIENVFGRVTTAGEVTIAGSKVGGDFDFPNSITAGPDGNLWFTTFASRIGRMAPSGEVTMFDGGTAGVAFPGHIIAGPDGNLWFTNAGNDSVGRITTAGEITTYPGSPAGVKEPGAITVGPD